MQEEDWKTEYKKMKPLKPTQIKLLDEGAQTQSQAWLVNSMWSDWKELKGLKDTELPQLQSRFKESCKDPWVD